MQFISGLADMASEVTHRDISPQIWKSPTQIFGYDRWQYI